MLCHIIIILINALCRLVAFAIPLLQTGCGVWRILYYFQSSPIITQKLFCIFLLMHRHLKYLFSIFQKQAGEGNQQWDENCLLTKNNEISCLGIWVKSNMQQFISWWEYSLCIFSYLFWYEIIFSFYHSKNLSINWSWFLWNISNGYLISF